MLSIFSPLRNLDTLGILSRILIACLCGGSIGLERSSKNRPAGFRTHMLVCLGAATAAMTGHYITLVLMLPADVTRMGAQIITGLGFLGAGTILVTKSGSVRGLTTAAGLWTTGIIGLSVGSGFYEGALLGAAMVLLTELLLFRLIGRMKRDRVLLMRLRYSRKNALDEMMRYCKDHNLAIRSLQVDAEGGENAVYNAEIQLHAAGSVKEELLLSHIRSISGIESAEL